MRDYRDYLRSDFDTHYGPRRKQWWKILIGANMVCFGIQVLVFLSSKNPRIYIEFLMLFGLHVRGVLEQLYLWQLFTYMFLHDVATLFHLLFNMLALYFFAPEIESRLGAKRFLFVYFACGVVAGVAYLIINAFARMYPVIGASGAIMGILVLYACYWPNRIVIFILFPMKVRTLVILLIVLDLYYSVMTQRLGGSTGVAHVAHLGGALFGYVFYRYERWFTNFLEGDGPLSGFSWGKKEVWNKEDFKEKLDAILDKVHREGMNNLSRKEKKFLKDASKRYKEDQD